MTIRIKEEDYQVKYTIRAMFIWEQIMHRPFELKTTLDNYAYFYALIAASNPDKTIKWDDFIDAVEDKPEIINELITFLSDYHANQSIFDEENAKKITGNDEKKN